MTDAERQMFADSLLTYAHGYIVLDPQPPLRFERAPGLVQTEVQLGDTMRGSLGAVLIQPSVCSAPEAEIERGADYAIWCEPSSGSSVRVLASWPPGLKDKQFRQAVFEGLTVRGIG